MQTWNSIGGRVMFRFILTVWNVRRVVQFFSIDGRRMVNAKQKCKQILRSLVQRAKFPERKPVRQ